MSYISNWRNPPKGEFEKQKAFARMYLQYSELSAKNKALADGLMEMMLIQQEGREFRVEAVRERAAKQPKKPTQLKETQPTEK